MTLRLACSFSFGYMKYPWIVPGSTRHGAELHHLKDHFHPGVVVRVLDAAASLAECQLPGGAP